MKNTIFSTAPRYIPIIGCCHYAFGQSGGRTEDESPRRGGRRREQLHCQLMPPVSHQPKGNLTKQWNHQIITAAQTEACPQPPPPSASENLHIPRCLSHTGRCSPTITHSDLTTDAQSDTTIHLKNANLNDMQFPTTG